MRTVAVSLVVGLVVAGAAAVLAVRREARRWFVTDEWDQNEPDEDASQFVPMAASWYGGNWSPGDTFRDYPKDSTVTYTGRNN